MAICGLGNDIVEIARVEASLARLGEAFAKRILTPDEFARFQSHTMPHRYLAKRFSAKEAVSKALGTGIGRGISFQHISISNNELGAPQVQLTDAALARLTQLGGSKVWLTISDEKHYAVTTAIIE